MPRFDFDATAFSPSNAGSLDPLPPGRYLAEIVSSGMRPNRSGRGSHIELEFVVADGEHEGRHLWSRLNVDHPNETAVRIAKQDLASICRAVGIDRLSETEELHGGRLVLVLRAARRHDTGETTTEIRGYAPAPGSASSTTTTAPSSTPQSATAGKERPWDRI